MTSGIEVRGVSFRYGDGPRVLSGLSLEARPGEVLGVQGVNGAGKTTLFRVIAGLLRAEEGTVHVAGLDVVTDSREAHRRLGFVSDEPLVYPRLSSLENLNQFGLLWGVSGADARDRGRALLEDCGLWQHRHAWAETLSRGMRQKLAICCAVLHRPGTLVLDEPFNGLDLEATLALRDLLRRRADGGDCIVLSSHHPETLDLLCDRLAILQGGCVGEPLSRAEVHARGGTAAVFREACERVAALRDRVAG